MTADMSSGSNLRCPICSKPFEDKKSQGRHLTYCKKKSRQPPRTRKRSCQECIRAKVHCDALSAPCSRCLKRNTQCVYESPLGADACNQISKVTRYVVAIDGECGSNATTPSLAQLGPLSSGWTESSNNSIPGHDFEDIISSQDLLLPPTTLALSPMKEWNASDVFNLPPIESSTMPWLNSVMPSGDPISQHLIPRPAKAFWPRGLRWRQLSLVRKSVLSTLRTFPKMMLSNSDLPQFIHSLCMAEDNRLRNNKSLGPLSRCAGIAAMWSTRNQNNQHYLWKILRTEQQRLSEESGSNNDWDAVSALQAITIYFLLRVSTEDDEDATFDVPLIQTMAKLAQRVKGVIKRYCDPDSPTRPSWEAWILVESLRRTISVLFIIEFLFDLSPGMGGAECNSKKNWSEMSLPSVRQLWGAKTRSQWEEAYRTLKNDCRPTFAELLKHDKIEPGRSSLLDWWMEQVDEFGMLVINAASLAEVIT